MARDKKVKYKAKNYVLLPVIVTVYAYKNTILVILAGLFSQRRSMKFLTFMKFSTTSRRFITTE